MKRSSERILTTHTGSLPRTAKVVELLLAEQKKPGARRAELQRRGGFAYPESQTPWQEIQRGMVAQLADGMVLEPAVKYQRVAEKSVPRDNH